MFLRCCETSAVDREDVLIAGDLRDVQLAVVFFIAGGIVAAYSAALVRIRSQPVSSKSEITKSNLGLCTLFVTARCDEFRKGCDEWGTGPVRIVVRI
jgi:hypothetical protein